MYFINHNLSQHSSFKHSYFLRFSRAKQSMYRNNTTHMFYSYIDTIYN
jgi:hypothetical protein